MKILAVLLCSCVAYGHAEKVCDQPSPVKLPITAAVVQKIETLHVGSTREELERQFAPSGLQSPEGGTFVYKGNALILLDVRFACNKQDNGHAVPTCTDRILQLSKPYLSLTFTRD